MSSTAFSPIHRRFIGLALQLRKPGVKSLCLTWLGNRRQARSQRRKRRRFLDGIIDDPRSCNYDANNFTCAATGNAPNCLTSAEAEAVNLIWDGPRNTHDTRIWYGLDRGTDFRGFDGSPVFPFVQIQFEWDEKDLSYVLPYGPPPLELPTSSKWDTVTLTRANNSLAYAMLRKMVPATSLTLPILSDRSISLKHTGGKMITFVVPTMN